MEIAMMIAAYLITVIAFYFLIREHTKRQNLFQWTNRDTPLVFFLMLCPVLNLIISLLMAIEFVRLPKFNHKKFLFLKDEEPRNN